jgi:hypothetical protein
MLSSFFSLSLLLSFLVAVQRADLQDLLPEPAVKMSPPEGASDEAPVLRPGGQETALSTALLEAIVADARTYVGDPAAPVLVVSATSKVWPDGSLGCPVEGILYPQIQVEGFQVILSVRDELLDYRGGNGRWRLCENSANDKV